MSQFFTIEIPKTIKDAPKWKEAILKKLENLERNETQELIFPKERNLKVANGYSQQNKQSRLIFGDF